MEERSEKGEREELGGKGLTGGRKPVLESSPEVKVDELSAASLYRDEPKTV